MRRLSDSGVTWLGKIPADWEVSRIGACVTERRETVSDTDFPALSVTKKGVVPQLDSAAKSDNSDGRKLIRKGDFVINSRSDRKGSSGVSNLDGSCSVVYTVLKLKRFIPAYAHHLFRSQPFQEEFYRWGTGIVDDLWSTRYSSMKQIPVPVPDRDEQFRIANFLDRQTAKIDALIAKQEQLISTLDKRRKAVIARYVFRGMNRDSKLVQTGNPQVAAIPNHWSLKRLRHFAQVESGADYKDFETLEDGFPVYGSGGVFAQARKYMYNGESVLFGRKGTIDKPLYVNGPFWTVDTMYWTRFTQPVNVKFVYYWATTVPFGLFTTSTALPSMTASDIKNFFVAMPPFSEQIEIVERLDGAVESIDHLTSTAQKTVETLKERRQALISATVTGKLEVTDGYS